MDPIQILVGLAAVVGAGGLSTMFVMMGRAEMEKARRRRQAPDAEDLRKLEEAVGQLSVAVTELYERLEFAERILATQRESERLGGGNA